MKIDVMTKDKDIKTVVPALRFPEFINIQGWKIKPLSSFLTEHKLKSNGKCEVHSVSLTEGVVNQIKYLGRSFAATDTSHYKLAKPYDVIYTKSPTGEFPFGIIKQNLNPYNVIVSPLYGVFSPPNKYIGYIIHSYFESPVRLNNYLSSIVQKGAKNTIQISNDTFVSKDVVFPDNEIEQKKIADCLLSLNDLISAVAAKIEALKEYKKGLMQQLFPAEGKTIPAFRFPEFSNTGKWENKMLSDVCKLVRGPFGGALKKEIFVDNGYAVYEQSHAIYGDMNVFRYHITEDKFNELIRFSVCPNDIIMSCSGTMGKFSIIPTNPQKGIINQALLKLSTKKGNDYRFIKLLLELPSNQEQLLSESAGGAIKNVASVGQIKEMHLCIPELNEQQKIADCLSSVDELISAETEKLNQLKAHQKGLMQQLFPNLQ